MNIRRVLAIILYAGSLSSLSLALYLFWRFHQALLDNTHHVELLIGMDVSLLCIALFCTVLVFMHDCNKKEKTSNSNNGEEE